MIIIDAAIIILLLIITAFAVILFKKSNTKDTNQAVEYLQKDIKELREMMDTKFDRNDKHVDKIFREQIGSSRKHIEDITKEIAEMKNTSKEILSFTDQLGQLEKILSNPKQRGALGEYFLETVLKNILPPNNYQLQYKFDSGEIVDAILFLDQNKLVPIDSKFSLENYNKILDETLSKAEINAAEKQLITDLKLRINETSKYIKPNEGTVEFAFMFIPSETLYYELLSNKIGQEEYVGVCFQGKEG